MNLCRSCHQDFASVEFERHRVGVHAYTYSDGVKMDPIREDGRRCLSAAEMADRGWRRDERRRWIDPLRAARARRMRIPTPGTASTVGSDEEAA